MFSSRASVDAIFHSNKNSSDTVDVLVVGFDDGTLHLRIFDCFEIGSFDIGSPDPILKSCKPFLHAAHPMSSTHVLLVSAPGTGTRGPLRMLTLDLRFITKSGRYLCLLASKTTQLQNLLRYINQVQRQIQLEWKNALELPARFMRNINEDLQEKCHCNFVTGLYHLVVTGDCFEPLKEFLVDIVSERVRPSAVFLSRVRTMLTTDPGSQTLGESRSERLRKRPQAYPRMSPSRIGKMSRSAKQTHWTFKVSQAQWCPRARDEGSKCSCRNGRLPLLALT